MPEMEPADSLRSIDLYSGAFGAKKPWLGGGTATATVFSARAYARDRRRLIAARIRIDTGRAMR